MHFKAIILLCIFLLSISNSKVLAQCDAGFNDTICLGESSLLIATGGGDYEWSTSATNDSIVVTPTTTTKYYVTVSGKTGNLICNSDFNMGDTCFASNYGHASFYYATWGYNVLNKGEYGITPTSGPPFAPWYTTCSDHTNPPTGNMMVVDGAMVPNVTVWTQTINVLTNTVYDFSAWVQSIHFSSPAQLQFRIDTALIGPVFTASTTTCLWQNFFVTWNSGTNTTANISIVNQNSVGSGNDFALDDITFSTIVSCIDSVTVVVNTLPTVNAGADVDICINDSTTLTASGGIKYNWNTGDTINPLTVKPVITTTYTVTGTDNNGCTGTDVVIVTVNSLPTVNAGADVDICINDSTTLTASGGIKYNWNTGDTINPLTVNPAITTTYTVIVADSNGCTGTDNIIVTVNPLPTVNLGQDQTICMGASYTFDAGAGYSSYQWQDTKTTQINTATIQGTYSVTVTDANGCSASDEALLKVINCDTTELWIPNAFSPNGDGNNDVFEAKWKNITNFKMYIYDRWGELIFESNDINKGWDGTFKNQLCQQGVYSWILFYGTNENDLQYRVGEVILIR